MTPEAIAGLGYDLEAVRQVVRLIRVNEYKRRQAPPGRAHHAALVWQGLALSDNIRLPPEGLEGAP